MNDVDEPVRRYLRSRADVPVPDDLHWPSAADDKRPPTAALSPLRWAGAAVVVLALVASVVALSAPPAGPRPSGPAATASAMATGPVDVKFPTIVAGMPVVSVARAAELLRGGVRDGRAVAVAGYFFQAMPFCPAPTRYIGPLEGWCRYVAFADDAASATLCSYREDGMSCSGGSGGPVPPFFVSETSGDQPSAANRAPTPLVLIGHAGDARQWLCGADTQETCRRAFVVDRIAWANGHDIPLSAPEPWDRTTSKELVPRMTMGGVIAALDGGDAVVAVGAFRARDISMVDPRWNMAGDDIVWIVRSIRPGDSNTDPTRSVTVSLVDDATGRLLDVHDLRLDDAFRPARLWTIATMHGIECCADNVYPLYAVRSGDGTSLHDGRVEGRGSRSDTVTTYGPGAPLVLGQGTYSVTAWLATIDGVVIGTPTRECSTEVTLNGLDDLMLEAVFPAGGGACTFEQPSPPRLTRGREGPSPTP